MRKTEFLCVLALNAGILLPAIGAPPIDLAGVAFCNRAPNPGFENGKQLPAGWGRYPKKDTEWSRQRRDTTVAHSGGASGLLWATGAHPHGKAEIQWNRYGIRVDGGIDLIVGFWVKAAGTKPVGAGIHFYDDQKKHWGFARIACLSPATDWTFVRKTVHVPEQATNLGFALYGGDHGKVWYDDVCLLDVPHAAAAAATPRIDGRLDDACWDPKRAITQFVRHPTGARPSEPTEAWIACDDRNLYVAFRCRHPAGAVPRIRAKEHDGNTWLDDAVEIFLAPHSTGSQYFQLCINAAGVLRDTRGRDGVAWESGAKVAVGRETAAWTVEIAIPYDRLGIDLDVGRTWRMDLVRDDWTHGRGRREVSTWSLEAFHRPTRFGRVEMKPDLSRFYRADLRRRLARLRERIGALTGKLDALGLAPADSAIVRKKLAFVRGRIREVDAVAAKRGPVPTEGWDAVRIKLGETEAGLAEARRVALSRLFNSARTGTPFHVVIADPLRKIRRSGPENGGILAREVRIDVARDETEPFQLVVVPDGSAVKNVTLVAGPLKNENGAELPVRWRRVGYVETAPPKYPTPYVGWWPDPLMPPGIFTVNAGERQPLWFDVAVPPSAAPGVYRGEVEVRAGKTRVTVPVIARVRSFRLPRPGTFAAPFGLYLYSLGAWWYGKDYRKMPIETFVRWCEFLGEYRLTPKSIARDYVKQEHKNGRWVVDATALRQTVGTLAPKYYPPYSFCLFRLPTAGGVEKYLKKDPALARKYLHGYVDIVRAYAEAWRKEKLPEKVYIYGCDEPRDPLLPLLRDAYDELRKAVPGYPIMQTISHPNPAELIGRVGIWCPLTPSLASGFYAARKKAGDTLWTYVCCSPTPPFANFFVDQPATSHRVLFWQARKAGATGLLYYCVCSWNGLPSAASGKKCFPDAPIHLRDHWTLKRLGVNGDGLLVYPGKDMTPIPSIRLETIRDGIEDYEYMALLERLLKKVRQLPPTRRPPSRLLKEADRLTHVPDSISRTLTDYTGDPEIIRAQRRRIADMIERLQPLLRESK